MDIEHTLTTDTDDIKTDTQDDHKEAHIDRATNVEHTLTMNSDAIDANTEQHLKTILEACLLTATSPLSLEQLTNIFAKDTASTTILKLIEEIAMDYKESGVELVKLADGYRFRSRSFVKPYLDKLYSIKPSKYSRSTMEILAIIAYKQPITRAEIEEIRGVGINNNAIQTLSERGWIEVVGHKQLPGKPELLATTNNFLNDLGISSLSELPQFTQEATQELTQEITQEVTQDLIQDVAQEGTQEITQDTENMQEFTQDGETLQNG